MLALVIAKVVEDGLVVPFSQSTVKVMLSYKVKNGLKRMIHLTGLIEAFVLSVVQIYFIA
jgi:hypothetical protein